MGDRVSTERTQEELHEEIKKLEAKLKHTSAMNENPVLLKEQINSKEHTLKGDISNYESLNLSIQLVKLQFILSLYVSLIYLFFFFLFQLKESRHKRYDVIKKLKQHMVMLLQFTFDVSYTYIDIMFMNIKFILQILSGANVVNMHS